MFILGNLVVALALALHYLLYAYMIIVIARALISWVSPDPYNPIVNLIYRVTEPVLRYVQKIIPPIGGIDFSPFLVVLVILFLDQFLLNSLMEIGRRLKGAI